jgi:hypothetical protein
MVTRLRYRLPLIILIFAILLPVSSFPAAQEVAHGENAATSPLVEVVVEDPQLFPPYTTCKDSYWYEFPNNRGHQAYLTLNTNDPTHSTNDGEWRPVIPQSGYYRVEAYIAGHAPITWCNTAQWPIEHDTTDARYTIHHLYGQSTKKVSQYALSNQWLNLGEYYFNAGTTGYVSLTDLNSETEYTTTVSFSAMRFTFTRTSRPQNYLPLMHSTDPTGKPAPDVGIVQAQGFDNCQLPTISQMQTWWNASPYSFYGLYLGGIHFASFCTKANSAWVKAVHDQGWSFIPTWVGPQAPCSGYKYKIYLDPSAAYHQGRQEADLASAAAYDMGITNYGWGGTVIYYDMESFGGASLACRLAVASFMNGWTERLTELGNFAGGYGARSSYITDWATVEHVPNDVWIASWYANGYDPYASVYGLTWLDGLWVHHQRLRQYAGEVGNTWGGLSLTIDINVTDGMIAMPSAKPLDSILASKSPSIEDTGWLSADQGWLVSDHHLYLTEDQGTSWTDISPSDVQMAYFLPAGHAWAVSIPVRAGLVLYRSLDRGQNWESIPITLPVNDWHLIQVQFSSPSAGWMVLQKQTSQMFSTAILIKTSDGGLTWQSLDLPAAARVSFSSNTDAWLQDSRSRISYHTIDGGLTWQPENPPASKLALATLPADTLISGWQTVSLGWAITGSGSCTGDKSTPDFTCQSSTQLWQSLDGGQDWKTISLPGVSQPNQ